MAKKIIEIGIKADGSFDNLKNGIDETVESAKTLKQQYRELIQELATLDEGSEAFTQASFKAAELKDQIGDINTRVNILSDDTFKLRGFISVAEGIAAGFAGATGIMQLFGGENKNLEKSLVAVQSALSVLNGVQSVSNLLQKESTLTLFIQNVVLKSNTISTLIAAAAESKFTVIRWLAVQAQTALNSAMAASGIGALIIAVGVAAAAWYGYSQDTDTATESTDQNTKSTDNNKTSLELLGEEIDRVNQKRKEYRDLINEQNDIEVQIEVERAKRTKSTQDDIKAEIKLLTLRKDAAQKEYDIALNNQRVLGRTASQNVKEYQQSILATNKALLALEVATTNLQKTTSTQVKTNKTDYDDMLKSSELLKGFYDDLNKNRLAEIEDLLKVNDLKRKGIDLEVQNGTLTLEEAIVLKKDIVASDLDLYQKRKDIQKMSAKGTIDFLERDYELLKENSEKIRQEQIKIITDNPIRTKEQEEEIKVLGDKYDTVKVKMAENSQLRTELTRSIGVEGEIAINYQNAVNDGVTENIQLTEEQIKAKRELMNMQFDEVNQYYDKEIAIANVNGQELRSIKLRSEQIDVQIKQIEENKKYAKTLEEQYRLEKMLRDLITQKDILAIQKQKAIAYTYGEIANQSIQYISQLVEIGLQENNDKINQQIKMLEDQLEDLQTIQDDIDKRQQESADRQNAIEDQLENSRGLRRERLLKALELEKNAKDKLAKEEIKLAEEKAKKEEQIEKKRREQEKIAAQSALLQASTQAALAVANIAVMAAAKDITFGVATVAAIGAVLTSVTAAIAASKNLSKFEKGGISDEGGILEGPSHTQGGIKAIVGGNNLIEMEGRELIINKGIWSRPDWVRAISEMNAQTGGKRFYNEGGISGTNFATINSSLESGVSREVMMLANRPIVTSITDIESARGRTNRIVENARI